MRGTDATGWHSGHFQMKPDRPGTDVDQSRVDPWSQNERLQPHRGGAGRRAEQPVCVQTAALVPS